MLIKIHIAHAGKNNFIRPNGINIMVVQTDH